MFILLLPLEELVRLYMNIISGAALSLSVFSAFHFVEDEIRIRNEIPPGESFLNLDFIKRHVSIIVVDCEDKSRDYYTCYSSPSEPAM